MAYHETAFDVIFEDSLSDSECEEGEIAADQQTMAECQTMDVDVIDGQNLSAEEGEIVEDEPPFVAFFGKPEEHGAVQSAKVGDDNHANGDCGQGEDLARPRQKKKKKKRSGKRAKKMDVPQFVKETCKRLQEKKHPLVWAAVKKLGVDGVRDLVKEVDVIEKCGGQMTNDGKRRRTPGGVMWNILRTRVPPDVYKEIMSQGNEVQKQKVKEAKESLKRTRMDVDEPVNNKRQKLAVKEGDISAPAPDEEQIKRSHQWPTPAKKLLNVTDGPQRDNLLLPAIQLQRAWVDGIRKKESSEITDVVPAGSLHSDVQSLKVGPVATDLPEKKPMTVFERLRIPIEYSDLVEEEKSVALSEEQIVPIESSDVVGGSFCEAPSNQDPEKKENDSVGDIGCLGGVNSTEIMLS